MSTISTPTHIDTRTYIYTYTQHIHTYTHTHTYIQTEMHTLMQVVVVDDCSGDDSAATANTARDLFEEVSE